MADELRFPEAGPKFEVWNHLESGLDLARLEIDDPVRQLLGDPPKFGAAERDLLRRWADIAFSGLTQLVLNPDAKELELQEIRRVNSAPGAEPWLDFAVDLRFAEEGVSRAQTALARYRELRRARLPPRLSARARHYVNPELPSQPVSPERGPVPPRTAGASRATTTSWPR